jgi:hypothetical protein
MMARSSFAQRGSGGGNDVDGDVVEKTAAPKMNLKEVMPMVVVVRGEI